ncbi:MAG TPA: hypothetical protein VD859_15900 [Nocardioides sp.]|nr:hypothetical protein [Nocardioides sp.]
MTEPADRTTAEEIVAAAAAERREAPASAVEAADLADRYDQMLQLADLFDDAGQQVRAWAELGSAVLADPSVTESAELSPPTWAEAEEALRAATTGRQGLLGRSIELDADALVLRATVLTYQWIDDLRAAAHQTLGAVAGRAIGYLAPEVALGGAIVAAGLIETDALDRDGVAAYLSELAEANPELMEHVTTGGGLLDSLQMRALLTAGVLAGERGRLVRGGGLRAAGVPDLASGFDAALRDAAIGLAEPEVPPTAVDAAPCAAPQDLAELMTGLATTTQPVRVQQLADDRFVVFLPGPTGGADGGRLRLVSGDHSGYVGDVVRTIEDAVGPRSESAPARVMLVGCGPGGAAAIEIAAREDLSRFVVDQVVTASSPSAQVPALRGAARVLSLEDRTDPVALLGSLINAAAPNRVTVIYDATAAGEDDVRPFVAGGRAADRADHPELVAEIGRLRELGFLAS